MLPDSSSSSQQNPNTMQNTSAINMNSTSFTFSFDVCLNGGHGGMILGYSSMFLCFSLFLLGTPAHCWLLWLYLRASWKIKPTQVFPLNLTILELIFCMQFAFQAMNSLIKNDIFWIVIYTIAGPCWVSRPLIQVCICVEQYLAVIHPVMFLKYKALQYRIAAVAVVWLIAAAYAVYQNTNAYNFPNFMFNILFFIAVIIISYCCVSVLSLLKHPGPGETQIPMERGRDVGNQQKRNACNTIFTGLLIILIAYLPQIPLSLINVSNIDTILYTCNILPTISTINILSVMITPLLKVYKRIRLKILN